jgi:hypothetical protein
MRKVVAMKASSQNLRGICAWAKGDNPTLMMCLCLRSMTPFY